VRPKNGRAAKISFINRCDFDYKKISSYVFRFFFCLRWNDNSQKLNSHNCEIPNSNSGHDVRPTNFDNFFLKYFALYIERKWIDTKVSICFDNESCSSILIESNGLQLIIKSSDFFPKSFIAKHHWLYNNLVPYV
jgi:hypothetical protein